MALFPGRQLEAAIGGEVVDAEDRLFILDPLIIEPRAAALDELARFRA